VTDSPDVASAYDRWSAIYDTDTNATRDLDAMVLRRAPLRLHGRTVLELGCGTGKNTAWLAEASANVMALDFSAGMLARAREQVSAYNVEFITHDLRKVWPVRRESVDVVVGNLVLEHIEDVASIFKEAARVLPPGGQLFICELHPYRQLLGSQAHFTDPVNDEMVSVAVYRHSTSEFVNSALAVGFALVELREWTEPSAEIGAVPRLLSLLFERG
jgi:ubiquinone/menaquinone biosynthesis C-methylase UbiE